MSEVRGIIRPDLQALPQYRTRLTFLYLERCKINRDANALTLWDKDGVVHIPAAGFAAILLGPGTAITHQAVELASETGVTLVWVGEQGVRFYACGRPMTHSSALLIRQAALVSNTRSHLMVARRMYQMRFPDEDVSGLTMQQLRGREGSRIRKVYRACAKAWHLEWNGREYDPRNFTAGDPVNQALSAGHACLYGAAHAVIAALGCSPGLGFVHVGHENSFIYDMADLYKAETTIPVAFEVAATVHENIGSAARRLVRDKLSTGHILERMVKDLHIILAEEETDESPELPDEVRLWNGTADLVANGVNYSDGPEENWEDDLL